MYYPIKWTSRLLPTLQAILLNGQKVPGWASVLKTFTSWNPQQFGHVFKSAGPQRFQLNPSCSSLARTATLWCPRWWMGLRMSLLQALRGQFSLLLCCLKSICNGCKRLSATLAVNLPLPFKRADKREAAWVFTPACKFAVLLCLTCFSCSTHNACSFFSPEFLSHGGLVRTWTIESDVCFYGDGRVRFRCYSLLLVADGCSNHTTPLFLCLCEKWWNFAGKQVFLADYP